MDYQSHQRQALEQRDKYPSCSPTPPYNLQLQCTKNDLLRANEEKVKSRFQPYSTSKKEKHTHNMHDEAQIDSSKLKFQRIVTVPQTIIRKESNDPMGDNQERFDNITTLVCSSYGPP
jgi:hypothetical protein